jgi:hypothetical protein
MRAVLGHAIKRSKNAAAEPIGVGFTVPISSNPDPRLVALVRILAWQAARGFIHVAWAGQESAASPIKEDF